MGIEKIFCFYFLVINVYKGKTTEAFYPCGKSRNGCVYIYVGARSVDLIRDIEANSILQGCQLSRIIRESPDFEPNSPGLQIYVCNFQILSRISRSPDLCL